jgi:hypothetical protein
MHRLQNTMLRLINLSHPRPRRFPPRQKHDSIAPHPRNKVNRLLRELLPSLAGVTVRRVCADSQTSVEHEDALLSPGSEETPVIRGCHEVRVVLFDALVDVDQRGGCAGGWADGEAEAVGLVVVVVGVLADDDGFDSVEGGVSGPGGYKSIVSTEYVLSWVVMMLLVG